MNTAVSFIDVIDIISPIFVPNGLLRLGTPHPDTTVPHGLPASYSRYSNLPVRCEREFRLSARRGRAEFPVIALHGSANRPAPGMIAEGFEPLWHHVTP